MRALVTWSPDLVHTGPHRPAYFSLLIYTLKQHKIQDPKVFPNVN